MQTIPQATPDSEPSPWRRDRSRGERKGADVITHNNVQYASLLVGANYAVMWIQFQSVSGTFEVQRVKKGVRETYYYVQKSRMVLDINHITCMSNHCLRSRRII